MKLRPYACIACLAIMAVTARAQVPGIINYQGRIVDNGTNFTGAGQFQFALVNGAGTLTYWSNDGSSSGGNEPTASVPLTVTIGLYSVLLGDTTLTNMSVIPLTVFTNSDVRLRVWFNDGVTGFQQLSPDQRVAAVGFSLMSANVPDGSITSNKIASGAVGPSALAAGVMAASDISNNFATASQALTINNLVAAAASTNYVNSAVAGETNGLPLGCSIQRGTNTLYFGYNITNWSQSIISGDTAYVVGGQYSLTNYQFTWSGKNDIVVRAISPQIQDIITANVLGGNGPFAMKCDDCTNDLILGDWNLREIFASSYPGSQDASLLGVSVSQNVAVDGLHAQLETPSGGIAADPYTIVMVNGDQNVSLRNARIGSYSGTPGGGCAGEVGAFHGNTLSNSVVFVNDIFYGEVWCEVSDAGTPPPPLFYNCYTLDPTGVSGPSQTLAVMGTIDTNENATYWLPGTPPDVGAQPTNSMKRMPPDCGTFTSATIGSATIGDGSLNGFVTASNLTVVALTFGRTNLSSGGATINFNQVWSWNFDTTSGISSNFLATNGSGAGRAGVIANNGPGTNALVISAGSGWTIAGNGTLVLNQNDSASLIIVSNKTYAAIISRAANSGASIVGVNLTFTYTVGGTNYTVSLAPTSHSP